MTSKRQTWSPWILVSLLAGCAPDRGDEPVGYAEEAAISPNAISPNAISPNAISPNAISPNAISPNALSPDALSPAALAALEDPGPAGALSRELVRYAVGCALRPSQSFQFSYTDAEGSLHVEVYPGSLGLAPGWASGPLSDTGQRMVTACLAARTNYSGSSVLISMRSEHQPLDDQTTAAERAAYPFLEGVFWGNLFSDNPRVHACHVPENAAHSREALRECAAGHIDPASGKLVRCGPILLEGPCDQVCSRFDAREQLYDRCLEYPRAGGSLRTSLVITTALP
jgi:hypothetical protein